MEDSPPIFVLSPEFHFYLFRHNHLSNILSYLF